MRSHALRLALAAAVTVASSCSMQREENFSFVSFDAGSERIARLLGEGTNPAVALESLRSQGGLPLSFWAEDVPEDLGSFVQEHPCGKTLTILTDRLPKPSAAPYLIAERVVEIDESGEQLRQWLVPIDSIVRRVDGKSLLVSKTWPNREGDVVTVGLSVEPDGQYRVITPPHDIPEQVDCPPLPDFGRSDYLRCWRVADPQHDQKRLVAYQSPCT